MHEKERQGRVMQVRLNCCTITVLLLLPLLLFILYAVLFTQCTEIFRKYGIITSENDGKPLLIYIENNKQTNDYDSNNDKYQLTVDIDKELGLTEDNNDNEAFINFIESKFQNISESQKKNTESLNFNKDNDNIDIDDNNDKSIHKENIDTELEFTQDNNGNELPFIYLIFSKFLNSYNKNYQQDQPVTADEDYFYSKSRLNDLINNDIMINDLFEETNSDIINDNEPKESIIEIDIIDDNGEVDDNSNYPDMFDRLLDILRKNSDSNNVKESPSEELPGKVVDKNNNDDDGKNKCSTNNDVIKEEKIEKTMTKVDGTAIANNVNDNKNIPENELYKMSPFDVWHYKITNLNFCPNNGKDLDILIGIQSGITYEDYLKREAIRQSWGTIAYIFGMKYVFVIGKTTNEYIENKLIKENEMYHDIIEVSITAGERKKPAINLMFFKWISLHCNEVNYVFLTENNVFLNVPLLKLFTLTESDKGVMYGNLFKQISPDRNPDSKNYISHGLYKDNEYPNYIGEEGVLFSGDLAKMLFEKGKKQQYFPISNIYISGILPEMLNIPRKDILLFSSRQTTLPTVQKCTLLSVTCLYYPLSADEILKFWHEIKETKFVCGDFIEHTLKVYEKMNVNHKDLHSRYKRTYEDNIYNLLAGETLNDPQKNDIDPQ